MTENDKDSVIFILLDTLNDIHYLIGQLTVHVDKLQEVRNDCEANEKTIDKFRKTCGEQSSTIETLRQINDEKNKEIQSLHDLCCEKDEKISEQRNMIRELQGYQSASQGKAKKK